MSWGEVDEAECRWVHDLVIPIIFLVNRKHEVSYIKTS